MKQIVHTELLDRNGEKYVEVHFECPIYINSVEQGKMMPSFEVIEQICDVLQISPVCLFDENASPKNIKMFNKDEYINGISDTLFKRLKSVISYEIRNTLK